MHGFCNSAWLSTLSFHVLLDFYNDKVLVLKIKEKNPVFKKKKSENVLQTFFHAAPQDMWDLSSPDQELNPRPLRWKCGVLTNGPPGKPPYCGKLTIRSPSVKIWLGSWLFTSTHKGNIEDYSSLMVS